MNEDEPRSDHVLAQPATIEWRGEERPAQRIYQRRLSLADEILPGDVKAAEDETVIYDDHLVAVELTVSINRWRSILCHQQQQVINLMFYAGINQAAVADLLHVTPARISHGPRP